MWCGVVSRPRVDFRRRALPCDLRIPQRLELVSKLLAFLVDGIILVAGRDFGSELLVLGLDLVNFSFNGLDFDIVSSVYAVQESYKAIISVCEERQSRRKPGKQAHTPGQACGSRRKLLLLAP